MTEFVCFVVEGQPHYVEISKCSMMNIQMEKKGLLYTVMMPKWVSLDVFTVLQGFLNNQIDLQRKMTDQTMQRLLWLGDHLQIDDFQETIIRDVILDRICISNCVLFLNEAYKKLKACEESSEVWYQLLNVSMNFTAKNLLSISPNDISKINVKVVEEILERGLKFYRKRNQSELLQVVFQIRNCMDVVSLINQQKELIVKKKINYQSHPSINWKLSNLSSIINKETQQFKFSDFTWKLVAKMEDRQVLRIYLKLEDMDPELNLRIISLYFQLNLNYTGLDSIKAVSIVAQKGTKIELCDFKGQELQKYDQQKLEFTVYLNTDQVLILCMNHLFNNLNASFDLTQLSVEDSLVLLQATPNIQQHQEKCMSLLMEFASQNQVSQQDYGRYIQCLHLATMGTEFLTKCLRSSFKQWVQIELDRRGPQQQRSYSVTKENQSSSRVIRTSGTGNKNDKSMEVIGNSQTRSQSTEKINQQYEMPVNKLQQLKKTPSQSKFEESGRKDTQQLIPQAMGNLSRRQVFDEINIVNFFKIKDPALVAEFNELIKQYY